MNILLTGASGLIGSALANRLRGKGHAVAGLRRVAAGDTSGLGPTWDPAGGWIELEPAGRLDAVIHLAGENIGVRWTRARKQRIWASRVEGTRLLCQALASSREAPKLLISASGAGFYGDRVDESLTEQSSNGGNFLAKLAAAWEMATAPASEAGIRVVQARLGMVLSTQGGALPKMLPIFRAGLGGRIGSGRQYWSWITLADVLGGIEHLLANEQVAGPVNFTTIEPVTSAEFSRQLAGVLNRPARVPVPGFLVQLLLGEMGQNTMLASVRALPDRLLKLGYQFLFPDLPTALKALLAGPDQPSGEGGAD